MAKKVMGGIIKIFARPPLCFWRFSPSPAHGTPQIVKKLHVGTV
jgi:hypothetical protein